jgi:hypothetical protein
MKVSWLISIIALIVTLAGMAATATDADETALRGVTQGASWTNAVQEAYYNIDQGSELIPLAWLNALEQEDGKPFLSDALARYGYLKGKGDLPVGFTKVAKREGVIVGLTCAACHTRELTVGSLSYRIDGAPAFADFQTFVADLDDAVRRVMASDAAFDRFAAQVLGTNPVKSEAKAILHAEVKIWSVRFHTLMDQALPKTKPWGPARLDAIGMIYNRVAALDLGPPPTYLLPQNVALADAPARYPFLWDVKRQDFTQWTGFAQNGSSFLALTRNLGQLLGVFGTFHPVPSPTFGPLRLDYLVQNSANIAGLAGAEAMLDQLEPPVWPWPVDAKLVEEGKAIFNRPPEKGGCAACHAEHPGAVRDPANPTWATPILNVGTDTRAWHGLLRQIETGVMEGAFIPDTEQPLRPRDSAIRLLKVAVLGTLVERQALMQAAAKLAVSTQAPASQSASAPARSAPDMSKSDMPKRMMAGMAEMAPAAQRMGAMRTGSPSAAMPPFGAYESRVLHGIWAVAPYLHNGSVPTLADLLRPPAERPHDFAVGPAYDRSSVGLARSQGPGAFVLHTTGCEAPDSGNSRCGHDYGTHLSPHEKRALLEYLKVFGDVAYRHSRPAKRS